MTIEYMNALLNPPNLAVRAQFSLEEAKQESSNSDQIVSSPELYEWLNDSDEANRDASGESSWFEEFVEVPSFVDFQLNNY